MLCDWVLAASSTRNLQFLKGAVIRVDKVVPESNRLVIHIIVGSLPRTNVQGKNQLPYIAKMDDSIAMAKR